MTGKGKGVKWKHAQSFKSLAAMNASEDTLLDAGLEGGCVCVCVHGNMTAYMCSNDTWFRCCRR